MSPEARIAITLLSACLEHGSLAEAQAFATAYCENQAQLAKSKVGATSFNWTQILQILLAILAALYPVINPPAPTPAPVPA
jgi:hypothetical protein